MQIFNPRAIKRPTTANTPSNDSIALSFKLNSSGQHSPASANITHLWYQFPFIGSSTSIANTDKQTEKKQKFG